MPSYKNLLAGDSAPWFHVRCTAPDEFAFDTAGGRYLVLCFFMTASDARGRSAIAAALEEARLFDEVKAAFFGVSVDPADKALNRVAGRVPGYRIFWDFDGNVSRLYGAIPHDADPTRGRVPLRRMWVVLDPTLRVMRVVPFAEDGSDAGAVMAYLRSLPPPERFAGFEVQAPVLVLPDVFEPEFCEGLIGLYDAQDRQETGFMVEVGGRTVQRLDPGHKRRRDHIIEDAEIVRQIKQRFARMVAPQVAKAFQYNATWMERYLVGCYRVEDGGYAFLPFMYDEDAAKLREANRKFLAEDGSGGSLPAAQE
jgi:peroxiredoxin